MADEFPVDIGPQYEGDTVRKENLHVDFGGPKVKGKFELVTLKDPEEIEDEKVEVRHKGYGGGSGLSLGYTDRCRWKRA
jgi:CO dehydrogenase/acetyl-CoA synthase beta subunit